jgi:hypoxanthine-DNA glycosylase
LLVARQVALWDVCRAAVRPGSLDSDIDLGSVVINDFAAFFRAHPRIEAVYSNGGTSYALYRRLAWPTLPQSARDLPHERLPSTSPAHAALRFEQKLERWRVVADRLAR